MLAKFLNSQIVKNEARGNQKSAVRNVQLFGEQQRALVELRTVSDAELTLALDAKVLEGRPLRVRWPKSSELASQAIPAQADEAPDKIFLGGLPFNLDEQVILQVCRQFGELSGFTLVRDRLTGLPRILHFCPSEIPQ